VAEKELKESASPVDSLTFLGTGGARFMIITQLLATGGVWFNLSGTEFLVDPGPGCIVQATKRKLNPEHLSAIIISHRHLDHSADVNIMTEAMTGGGFRRRGCFYAPGDAIIDEPVMYDYLKKRIECVEPMAAGKSYSFDDVHFSTPVRHQHGVETYGLVFKTEKHTISWITDTRYFDGLADYYRGDLLLMNVVFPEPKVRTGRDESMPIDHLSLPDAEILIKEIKPKVAIMTHFGMGMWRAKPWELAEKLSQSTGVRVIAARDGMKFKLSELDTEIPEK
jgi:phosphoribosyl 1,2-cyclic phosphodiesterase